MSDTFSTSPIGHCEMIDGRFAIRLMPDNREGLSGLADFSHAIALWWAHQADSADLRTRLTVKSPYTVSFADFGVFFDPVRGAAQSDRADRVFLGFYQSGRRRRVFALFRHASRDSDS